MTFHLGMFQAPQLTLNKHTLCQGSKQPVPGSFRRKGRPPWASTEGTACFVSCPKSSPPPCPQLPSRGTCWAVSLEGARGEPKGYLVPPRGCSLLLPNHSVHLCSSSPERMTHLRSSMAVPSSSHPRHAPWCLNHSCLPLYLAAKSQILTVGKRFTLQLCK